MQFTSSELVAAGAVGWMVGLATLYAWYWYGEAKRRKTRLPAKWKPIDR